MGQLQGKSAVVTGAGNGIGRAIARRYASEGANVIVAELDADNGRATAEAIEREFGTKAIFLPTDVKIKAQVEAMIATAADKFGGVDILVNCAWGGGTFEATQHKSDDTLQHGLAMNLWAGFWAMKAAFPHMKAKGGGRIISLCTFNGVYAVPGTLEYNVSKEALRTLTRTVAREWAQYQICANIICPAAATGPALKFLQDCDDPEAAMKNITPLGWMGDPERDIAGVALFLASEDSRYMTGNTLFVDGGTHINGRDWPNLPD